MKQMTYTLIPREKAAEEFSKGIDVYFRFRGQTEFQSVSASNAFDIPSPLGPWKDMHFAIQEKSHQIITANKALQYFKKGISVYCKYNLEKQAVWNKVISENQIENFKFGHYLFSIIEGQENQKIREISPSRYKVIPETEAIEAFAKGIDVWYQYKISSNLNFYKVTNNHFWNDKSYEYTVKNSTTVKTVPKGKSPIDSFSTPGPFRKLSPAILVFPCQSFGGGGGACPPMIAPVTSELCSPPARNSLTEFIIASLSTEIFLPGQS